MTIIAIAWIILLIIVILICPMAISSIKLIGKNKAIIVSRLGRYMYTIVPGERDEMYLFLPFVTRVKIVEKTKYKDRLREMWTNISCPKCGLDSLSPDTEVCPNCGYIFIRKSS